MNRTLVVSRRKQETSQTSWIALAGPQQGPGEALRAEKKKKCSTKALLVPWTIEGGMDHLPPRDAKDVKEKRGGCA